MRKARIIVAFALSASLLHGCDFLRILAGRPTSREIEEKRRAIMLMDRVEAQEPEDTVALTAVREPAVEQPAVQETQPATEPAKAPETKQEVKQAAAPGGIRVSTRKADLFAEPRPTYRYYVMIGTFGSRDNAVRLSGKAGEAGYPVSLLPFANGMTAVGVCPSDDFGDICASLEKLRKESFCPKDACILKIE